MPASRRRRFPSTLPRRQWLQWAALAGADPLPTADPALALADPRFLPGS